MRFKPTFWFPVAAIACGVNLVWAWVAARTDGAHALAHFVATLGFGLWAVTLRSQLKSEHPAPPPELPAGFEALEAEMNDLRQQLIETQERLDFTERMLAQRLEADRVKQDR
jgi:hypothetical protein